MVADLRRDVACDEQVLTGAPGELPVVSPRALGRRHGVVWSIGGPRPPAFSCVLRHEVESGRVLARDFGADIPAEPLFAPDPGSTAEDGGWLLVPVYRAGDDRSDLVVLDARDLAHVATLRLPGRTPMLFHGCWVPAAPES